jgi:hypothetical protein
MRLSNPLLLTSLGVLLAAASCTLITDVDRSKIPDGVAGVPSGGEGNTQPSMGGEPSTGGKPGVMGGQGPGGAGPGPTPTPGGAGGMENAAGNASLGGAPSDAGAGGMMPANAGAGGN